MKALATWHDMMKTHSNEGLWDLIHPDCVFLSPVVHTPQRGREVTFAYLSAAQHVFSHEFHYVREVVEGNNAMLEFECVMDDVTINGVDMITFEGEQIIDFKVMVRPLKGVNKVHEKMMAMLEKMHKAG